MKINILGIDSDYTNYITNSVNETSGINKFQSILEEATLNSEDENDEELKDACKEYETYFIQKLFEEMRKTIPESEMLEKSTGHDTYEDMVYDEMAKEISEAGGIGIADMMYEELSKK
jgi:flagellar protein FlgJ